MNLIEPMILAGAVLGAGVGATLGFSAGVLWGLGGLVAGVVLGPVALIALLLLAVTLGYHGPRYLLGLLRGLRGPRSGN
ncbi:hypothetical protein ACLESD_49080 [Pyxidicoccus sp. 3LFB2]